MIKQLKKNINLFLFLISAFAASNIFSSTNNIYSDYQKKIDEIKNTFAAQWDILTKEADNVAASIKNSKKNQFLLLDELMQRIKNKNDPFDDLEKYKSVTLDSASAHLIYNTAYDMYYRKHELRAGNLFLFLISDKNPNRFTIGNSYYWLAVILNDDLKDEKTAFKYYMMVHKYPACLVFTANSYIKAADILINMFQIENPLALLAIDVPTYNYKKIKCLRHLISANLCFNKSDYTNAVRHLQVVYFTNTNEMQRVQRSLKRCPNNKALWNTLLTNRWNENFMIKTIQNGISSPEETPDDDLFFDAITHDWPTVENVSDVILKNRTLSNNIFPQKRKKIDKCKN